MTNSAIGSMDWAWVIPQAFIHFTLEDFYNSQDHHYGVRCSPFDQIQPSDTEFFGRLDLLLSSRLRKMPPLPNQTQGPMVVQDGRGDETKQLSIFHNLDL